MNIYYFQAIDGFQTAITKEILRASDDDEGDEVLYKVFQPSKYGQIYFRSEPTVNFTQRQVDADRISFRQNDPSLNGEAGRLCGSQ